MTLQGYIDKTGLSAREICRQAGMNESNMSKLVHNRIRVAMMKSVILSFICGVPGDRDFIKLVLNPTHLRDVTLEEAILIVEQRQKAGGDLFI